MTSAYVGAGGRGDGGGDSKAVSSAVSGTRAYASQCAKLAVHSAHQLKHDRPSSAPPPLMKYDSRAEIAGGEKTKIQGRL